MKVEPFPLQATAEPLPKRKASDGVYSVKNLLRSLRGNEWYSCRDEFHSNVGTGKGKCKGFYYGTSDPLSVIGLVDWVERALNIHPKHRIQLFVCQKDTNVPPETCPFYIKGDGILLFKLSEFWWSQKIRFYFITALCKASYDSVWFHPLDTILEAHYFNQTRRAVGMFLAGHTVYTGGKNDSNWVQLFNDPRTTRNLARPSSDKELMFFYDNDPRPQLLPEEKWRVTKWVRQVEGNLSNQDLEPFGF